MTRAVEILVFGAIAMALHAIAAPQMAGRVVPEGAPPKSTILTIAAPPPAVSRHVNDWERQPVVLSALRPPRSPAMVRSPGSVATVARPRRLRRPAAVAPPRRDVSVTAAVGDIPSVPRPAAAPIQGPAPTTETGLARVAFKSLAHGSANVQPRLPAAVRGADGGPLAHVVIPPLPAHPSELAEDGVRSGD